MDKRSEFQSSGEVIIPRHEAGVSCAGKHGEAPVPISEQTTAVREDTIIYAPEKGIYGVFDGMGGESYGDIASQLAAKTVYEVLRGDPGADLPEVMSKAREAVINYWKSGYTTALFGKLEKKEFGAAVFRWANAGDCRMGLIRNCQLTWVNEEQGFGASVANGLGAADSRWPTVADEYNQLILASGDILFLASDGITGDRGDERLSDEQIIAQLANVPAQIGANRLLEFSVKRDDKSLIVIRIE